MLFFSLTVFSFFLRYTLFFYTLSFNPIVGRPVFNCCLLVRTLPNGLFFKKTSFTLFFYNKYMLSICYQIMKKNSIFCDSDKKSISFFRPIRKRRKSHIIVSYRTIAPSYLPQENCKIPKKYNRLVKPNLKKKSMSKSISRVSGRPK